MTNRLSVALAATFAGAMLASGAVSAATVSATGGYGAGAYPTVTIYGTVNGVNGAGYAGVAKYLRTGGDATQTLLTNSPAGVFYAICLEFNEFLQGGTKTWTVSDLSSAPDDANNNTPTGMGAARAADLARLLNGAYANWGSAPANVTALQLAVWEIAIENSGTYDLSTGLIKFLTTNISTTTWNLAQSYLNNVSGRTSGFNDSTMRYLALTNDGTQDFVVKTVPLPAAAWLLLSGLAGFGALARRRKPA